MGGKFKVSHSSYLTDLNHMGGNVRCRAYGVSVRRWSANVRVHLAALFQPHAAGGQSALGGSVYTQMYRLGARGDDYHV